MADDHVGVDLARAQGRVEGEAGRHERGLLHLGVDEVLDGPFEAQLLEIHARGRAARVVHGHRLRHGCRNVLAHPGFQRALAGEHEGDLRHAAAPVV